jgi:hypothetical protein
VPGLRVILDPEEVALAFEQDEDDEAAGYFVMSPLRVPRPEREQQWTSNADTEGELAAGGRDKNIEIPPKLRIVGRDEADFRERQIQLAQKLHKYGNGEGGTLRLVFPDGVAIDYEIRGVKGGEGLIDNRYIHSWRAEEEVTFICGPFGVGEEILVGEFSGSDRVLECVVDEVPGTAEALGRAEIVSPGADVWELLWGRDSRYFEQTATAQARYAAKDLTPLGGATPTTTTVDGKAGVSVVRATLTPNWTAGLSTDVGGVGPLTHKGVFELYAWIHMPISNAGEVAILGEYGVGDLSSSTELEPTYFPANHFREGQVVRLTLGQVWLRAPRRGEHQWQARLVHKSTVVGDKLDFLDVGVRSVEERSGRISASPVLRQPTALLARDEFAQSGILNGQTLAASGTSAGPSSPTTVAEDATVGTQSWVNLANAKGFDGSVARAGLTYPQVSKYLKVTGLGFAIPGTATIKGIALRVRRRTYSAGAGGLSSSGVRDQSVKLVKAGAIAGSEHANPNRWSHILWGDAVYGGPSDLWGTTWTPAQVNAANFGAVFAGYNSQIETSTDAEVDGFQVTVYYSEGEGEKWVTSGDADDFTLNVGEVSAQRTAVSDANILAGRYAIGGNVVNTDIVVGIHVERSSVAAAAGERIQGGALARYVDENNWLFFGLDISAPAVPVEESLRILKRVGGEPAELGRIAIPAQYGVGRSVFLHVDRRGRWFAWGSLLEGGIPRLLAAGQDRDLVTGGALDDGKSGFYDSKTGSSACTRLYDNYVTWIPQLQATIFEGHALELGHDAAERESISGGGWVSVVPEFDYLKLAPSGLEHRKNRLVFMASPHDPELMGVGFPNELKVALYATPRYRGVPDPA